MCTRESCIRDLTLLFIVDECLRESVGCPQHLKNNGILHGVCAPFREAVPYLSRAVLVAMLRPKPRTPCCLKYGMAERLAAMMATESDGFTKKPFSPRIMQRSWEKIEIPVSSLKVKSLIFDVRSNQAVYFVLRKFYFY